LPSSAARVIAHAGRRRIGARYSGHNLLVHVYDRKPFGRDVNGQRSLGT
jgi:hypothetical protein